MSYTWAKLSYLADMVLSSQTTKVGTRHVNRTDVAACWGNLAGAAATGALGCNSLALSNLDVSKSDAMLGDTETGPVATRKTLLSRKIRGGVLGTVQHLPHWWVSACR